LHDKLATSRLANESAFSRLRLGGLKRCFNLQFATHRQPLGAIPQLAQNSITQRNESIFYILFLNIKTNNYEGIIYKLHLSVNR